MHATQVFARYGAGFSERELPTKVLHHAKRAVIDWHAAAHPGFDTPSVRLLRKVLRDELDRGAARLVTGQAATARAAALINGTAAHAAELDDSFRDAMYHPGAATIAAALAAAHSTGATGRAFLRGVVLGYEISTRIGVVLGRDHYRFWHNTGTVGSFGAAAAAGAILGLQEAPLAHALALAATFAAGLQQAFRMDAAAKPLHAGRAAEAGLLAAQLAASGMTGSLDVVDGDAGFGAAMSNAPDWSAVGATLGSDFHITRLTFKNHVGCGHAFPAIDGALELKNRHGLQAADIGSVRIATYQPALDIAGHASPTSADEARFSLRYMVASALVHGSVRLAAYEPPRLKDPATRDLLERITVAADPELDAAFPGQRAARVDMHLRDGRHLTHLQPMRKGDPEWPLTDADLENKLLEFATPAIGNDAAHRLLAHLWALDESTAPP
jgi:2-methylcitrate dehydratase PrpD